LSFVDDLVSKHLRVAEATGDVPKAREWKSLEKYVTATKHIVLDAWQRDLCARIEKVFWLSRAVKFDFDLIDIGTGPAFYVSPSGLHIDKVEFEQKKGKGCQVAIHGPPQHGKSIVISQSYPAWIFGWDPEHRFRLATYAISHSKEFSETIVTTLRSDEHKYFFPEEGSRLPNKLNLYKWYTAARRKLNDGQSSFTALGLASGFVGVGYDTLLMDDPFASDEDALSEAIRDKSWRFYTNTAHPRSQEHSNEMIMFHRYYQDDMAGRAMKIGFDLWRYAAQADGDYEDEGSGNVFPCLPLSRKEGEYLTQRNSARYYADKKTNDQIWQSQFQGRPSAKTGKLFNVTLLNTITPQLARPLILHWVRAWDNAATSGGGAYTAGALMGIDAAENVYVFDMVREQLNTAERQIQQQKTAEEDGKLVEIHAPEDPGSAGKDIAFDFTQTFARQGYKVTTRKAGTGEDASGNRSYNLTKTMRALGYSKAVNSSQVFLVLNEDGTTPDWHKPCKNEMQYFPNSTFKDQIDCMSDGYEHLMRLFRRGLVVKTAAEHNLLHRSRFEERYGRQIPKHWEVSAAVRIAQDSSRPSGYAIVARAAANAYIGDVVFIVAAERLYADNPVQVLTALQKALEKHCETGVRHPSVIWLNKGAGDVLPMTAQKMDLHLCEFQDDATAGILETNYYLQPTMQMSPFYKEVGGGPRLGATRCYALVADKQFDEDNLIDEDGMLSLRQDWSSWSYNDKGEIQAFAGIVLDCVRMTLYNFALSATGLTAEERLYSQLPKNLQPGAVGKLLGTPAFVEAHFAQNHALTMLRLKEAEEKMSPRRDDGKFIGARAVTHRFSRGDVR